MKSLGNIKTGKMSVIPNNSQKYVSFSYKEKGKPDIRFVDSLSFILAPLSSLVENLEGELPIVDQAF